MDDASLRRSVAIASTWAKMATEMAMAMRSGATEGSLDDADVDGS